MKKLFLIILFMFLTIEFAEADIIKIMSYNIRYPAPEDYESGNGWNDRKERLVQFLKYHNPKIIGMQEAVFDQITYINNQLRDYTYVGAGRDDGKEKGEFTPIMFDTTIYSALESNTYWLSETPDKPSKGWDAALNRVITYVRLKNKYDNTSFFVFNTHFDHKGLKARDKSAELVIELIDKIAGNSEVILLGDFNTLPDSQPYNTLKEHLTDAYLVSINQPYGPAGTSSGFKVCSDKELNRIDFIFTSRNISVINYSILTDFYYSNYHSDHLPVTCEILISKRKE